MPFIQIQFYFEGTIRDKILAPFLLCAMQRRNVFLLPLAAGC
jgi:hypothetical protein